MLNIDELIKNSYKEHKFAELRAYRNLKSMIMAFKTQKNAPEYTEASEVSLIRKYISQANESLQMYTEANRDALANECLEEIEILERLLPAPVRKEDIAAYLIEVAESNGWFNGGHLAIPKKEMGNAIKIIKQKLPTVDGKIASEVVKLNLE